MEYFTRFTANPQEDLELGHSFVGYQMASSKHIILSILAENDGVDVDADDFDFEAFAEDNEHRIAYSPASKMWGIRRSGLCGFGPFETLEEAESAVNDPDYQYHFTPYCVIYTGHCTYDQELDGLDDGRTFRPMSIAKIFHANSKTKQYEVENA